MEGFSGLVVAFVGLGMRRTGLVVGFQELGVGLEVLPIALRRPGTLAFACPI